MTENSNDINCKLDYYIDEVYSGLDLSLLKKLTIVIPTFNRNYYLSRCLWYHAHFPYGEIIVADSSTEQKKIVNRETVAKVMEIFGANITYLEYEQETDKYGGDIYKKWGDAVQHVNTDYSIICIDKEFLSPSWILKSICFLDENTKYITVYTDNYYLRQKSRLKSNNAYYYSVKYENYLVHNCIIVDKMNTIFSISPPWTVNQLFAVVRTNIHKKVYDLLEKSQICDIRYGELLLGYGINMYGEIHYIEGYAIIRDVAEISLTLSNKRLNSKESSDSRYPHFKVLSEVSNLFYENFINCINGELQQIDGSRLNISFNDIMRYDNREGSKAYKLMIKYNKIHYLWYNYVPIIFQNFIRSVVKRVLPSVPLPDETVSTTKDPYLSLVAKIVHHYKHNGENDEPVL